MASPGDARLERILANVLWTGVVASSLSLAVGLVLTLASGGAASGPWLTIGLLTLMATPVARVVVSAIAYVVQRDWLFAFLTSLVLLELAASVVTALVFRADR
ncbi:MAG: hypothetical protein DMF89_22770 [Acidobacteria bacterium]|nr:MAG: hypothetical protein DMF89_22770 [Acidobacteriota bacterium]